MSTLKDLNYREREKPIRQMVSIRLEQEQYDRLNFLCEKATVERGKYTAQAKLIGALIDAAYEAAQGSK